MNESFLKRPLTAPEKAYIPVMAVVASVFFIYSALVRQVVIPSSMWVYILATLAIHSLAQKLVLGTPSEQSMRKISFYHLTLGIWGWVTTLWILLYAVSMAAALYELFVPMDGVALVETLAKILRVMLLLFSFLYLDNKNDGFTEFFSELLKHDTPQQE